METNKLTAEKHIEEANSILNDVIKSMPECANKAFLKGVKNELALAGSSLKEEIERLKDELTTKNVEIVGFEGLIKAYESQLSEMAKALEGVDKIELLEKDCKKSFDYIWGFNTAINTVKSLIVDPLSNYKALKGGNNAKG